MDVKDSSLASQEDNKCTVICLLLLLNAGIGNIRLFGCIGVSTHRDGCLAGDTLYAFRHIEILELFDDNDNIYLFFMDKLKQNVLRRFLMTQIIL